MQNKKFNSYRLKEIREIRGYTQSSLAEEIGKSRNAISLYEKGSCYPEDNTLHQLSNVLKIPIDYFYKDKTIDLNDETPIFFRKLVSANKTHRMIANGKIKWLAELYLFLSKYLKFPAVAVQKIDKNNIYDYTSDEIEDIAYSTRKQFGLELGPIGNMINILEYHGIFMGMFSIANTLDAFSCWSEIDNESRPFILLDQIKDSSTRSRFNCAHELGHLILHSMSNDIYNMENKKILDTIEYQANKFASCFLLPRKTFSKQIKNSNNIGELLKLKKEWGVSIQAMIMRSFDLGFINENQKIYMFKKINYLGYSKRDPADDYLKIETPSLIRESLNKLLENRIISVRNLYEEFLITLADLSELTGIEKEYFQNFSKENLDNLIDINFYKEFRDNNI